MKHNKLFILSKALFNSYLGILILKNVVHFLFRLYILKKLLKMMSHKWSHFLRMIQYPLTMRSFGTLIA